MHVVFLFQQYHIRFLHTQSLRAAYHKFTGIILRQSRIQHKCNRFAVRTLNHRCYDIPLRKFCSDQTLIGIALVLGKLFQSDCLGRIRNERREFIAAVDIQKFCNRTDFVRRIILAVAFFIVVDGNVD